jgi:HSP20 family molecular chaperone IbpA
MRSFTPRFDVKETTDAYELHGELPGIEQKDIEIEFVDAETLTIKGRVERSYTSGTPPTTSAQTIEGTDNSQAAIKDKAHQPTVEDEDAAVARVSSSGNNNGTVATTNNDGNAVKKAEEPKEKLWVSERSVGEFSRSFTFPVRVEQDAVKASMRNGVLSVVVPKAKKVAGRKINIE